MATTKRKAAKKRPPTRNRPGSRKRKPSKWEMTFAALCEVNEWPVPVREYRFHEPDALFPKKRQWRFDFAWPEIKLAAELDGGLFRPMSGHRSPMGLTADRTKDSVAQLQGWMVLRFTELHFREGIVEPIMNEAFRQRMEGRPNADVVA